MGRTALIQVLGAVAYGELHAHEGAVQRAALAPDQAERQAWERIAAQELRHYEGFRTRLEALGADPDRAMRPYRAPLDAYHANQPADEVEEAVWDYMGEGIADDLLLWLRRVVDADTAAFIDTVIADEEQHEDRAADSLRALLDRAPGHRRRGRRAARRMVLHMLASGRSGALPMLAFLRLGRAHELVGALVTGQVRRLQAVGIGPRLPLPVG